MNHVVLFRNLLAILSIASCSTTWGMHGKIYGILPYTKNSHGYIDFLLLPESIGAGSETLIYNNIRMQSSAPRREIPHILAQYFADTLTHGFFGSVHDIEEKIKNAQQSNSSITYPMGELYLFAIPHKIDHVPNSLRWVSGNDLVAEFVKPSRRFRQAFIDVLKKDQDYFTSFVNARNPNAGGPQQTSGQRNHIIQGHTSVPRPQTQAQLKKPVGVGILPYIPTYDKKSFLIMLETPGLLWTNIGITQQANPNTMSWEEELASLTANILSNKIGNEQTLLQALKKAQSSGFFIDYIAKQHARPYRLYLVEVKIQDSSIIKGNFRWIYQDDLLQALKTDDYKYETFPFRNAFIKTLQAGYNDKFKKFFGGLALTAPGQPTPPPQVTMSSTVQTALAFIAAAAATGISMGMSGIQKIYQYLTRIETISITNNTGNNITISVTKDNEQTHYLLDNTLTQINRKTSGPVLIIFQGITNGTITVPGNKNATIELHQTGWWDKLRGATKTASFERKFMGDNNSITYTITYSDIPKKQ